MHPKILISKLDYNETVNVLLIFSPLFLMIFPKVFFFSYYLVLLFFFLLKIKRDGIRWSFLEKYILIFLLTLTISLISSPYAIGKGLYAILKIMVWIFFPLILGQFEIHAKTKKYMLYAIFMGIIVYFIRFYMHKYGVFTRPLYSGDRYSGGYMISQVSLILAVLFVLFLSLLLAKIESKAFNFYLWMINLMTLIMLLITKTRGIYLAILLVIPMLVLMKDTESFFITLLLGSIFLVSISFAFPKNKYVKRFQEITQMDVSSLGRLEVWQESYRIFKKYPVSGVGYMNFKKAHDLNNYKINSYYAHSHSMVFKMLSEAGVIGIFGYLLLNLKLLFRSIRRGRGNVEYFILFGVLSILLMYELTEVLIWRNFAYPFIYFIFAVILNSEYQKKLFWKNNSLRSNHSNCT